MAWTKSGTVSVTNASATVYGAGTTWASAKLARAGDIFKAPDGRDYEVANVQSNTQLTLTSAYLGTTASAQAYALIHTGLLPAELAVGVSDLQSKYLATVSQLYEWETSAAATVPMTNPATGVTESIKSLSAFIAANTGINTGDETAATLKTKLGITTLAGVNTGDQTATTTPNTPAGNIVATTVQSAINELDAEKQPRDANLVSVAPGAFGDVLVWDGSKWAAQASPEDAYAFSKADSTTPAFTKTSASTLSVKAGSSAKVSGVKVSWPVATAVTMPALTGGTNYAIYVCADGSLRADSNWSAPAGYTTANSRKIGGFHFGLVAPGTTVAGGSFNAAGSPVGGGMVWTQGDVNKIAGINEFSLWDLKFRPACADPRGMVLVNGSTWVDIYLCSTDTAANGTSKAGSNIASGTVLPKVPAAFGGNGALAYTTLDWWVANELARANQKRLMLASEFYDAAFGVTENQSIDATGSTYPVTQRNAGYTSRYGIEQASGHHWTWGQDSAGSASAYFANGGRGQSYNNSVVRVLLGGSRTNGSDSGSRCSRWDLVSSHSSWGVGLRAAADHLQLV